MASNTDINDQTTATEAAAALAESIRGKNVVVTGVSPASIGYTTALSIASQAPATLILASRTQSKLDAVASDIAKKHPSVPVKTVLLDLSSVASITSAASTISALTPRLDVLINNAGVNPMERTPLSTPDGSTVDTQFFTNHVGPFLLTTLLLPHLRASPSPTGARVVNVSSHGHRLSPVRFSDLAQLRPLYDTAVPAAEHPRKGLPPFFLKAVDGYAGFIGYGQSKSANILHAAELTRRMRAAAGPGVVVGLSVHPGTIATELSRHLDDAGRETINSTAPHGQWKNLDQGSATTVVAAFDPALAAADFKVGYMSDCQLRDDLAAEHATDPEMARRLWEVSEHMLQISTESKL